MELTLGLQLYSLRDEVKGDFPALLRRVKAAGYDGVEFAGFHGMEAPALRARLDEIGLVSIGSHTPVDDLRNCPDEVIAYNKTLGTRFIVLPWAEVGAPEAAREVAALCASVGEKIADAGMRLLYHNHSGEFEHQIDGKPALEWLRDEVPARALGFELDIFWAQHAGRSPVEVIGSFGSRIEALHLKDMNNAQEKKMTEIGTGIVPIGECIRHAAAQGASGFIVEQDDIYIDRFESVTLSARGARAIAAGL